MKARSTSNKKLRPYRRSIGAELNRFDNNAKRINMPNLGIKTKLQQKPQIKNLRRRDKAIQVVYLDPKSNKGETNEGNAYFNTPGDKLIMNGHKKGSQSPIFDHLSNFSKSHSTRSNILQTKLPRQNAVNIANGGSSKAANVKMRNSMVLYASLPSSTKVGHRVSPVVQQSHGKMSPEQAKLYPAIISNDEGTSIQTNDLRMVKLEPEKLVPK